MEPRTHSSGVSEANVHSQIPARYGEADEGVRPTRTFFLSVLPAFPVLRQESLDETRIEVPRAEILVRQNLPV
jgi:hypothetical protein